VCSSVICVVRIAAKDKEEDMKVSKVCVLLLLLASGMVSQAGAQSVIGKVTLSKIQFKGTSVLGAGSGQIYGSVAAPFVKPDHDLVAARRSSVSNQAARANSVAATLSVPAPTPNSVTNRAQVLGFQGLSTVDSGYANGFVLTPPDQGLCAGHGFVVETINLALVVFNQAGARLTVPQSMNSFYQLDPATTFLADPRCYYDAPTQRWFISMLNVYNSVTGRSDLLLAVSQTSDPRGAYYIYSIDDTDDGANGTPSNPTCPCFGDQPLLGADANGVYLSTNEFPLFASGFNGAQIYAVSKRELEAGGPATLVHYYDLPLAEGLSYSVQPASSPDLNEEEGSGVEYFLSALDFYGTLDNRIAVWALTNTQSLSSTVPSVSLTSTIVTSEAYGVPPNSPQKAGPYPLGQSLGDPEGLLSTNDDRMNNVVFASGKLWAGLNTVLSDGKNINAGIAYFDVRPSMSHGVLSASMVGQNYISVAGNSVMYPGIGVTADGAAAAAFTLAGASYYPSAAYAKLTPAHALSVNVVAAGAAPSDDFSMYPQFGPTNGSGRWGDYSWGVADGGSIWLATEYIPGGIDSLAFYTNYSTYVMKVTPQ
jgi:hypothetical protein